MGLFKSKKDKSNERQVITSKKVYNLKSNGKYEIVLEGKFISITAKGIMNSINKGFTGTKKICLSVS